MALCFQVGTFAYAWESPYNEQLANAVTEALGYVCTPVDNYFPGYFSEDLAWSGWKQLQDAAASVIGRKATPHLQAVEAWKGVYLPLDLAPCEVYDKFNPSCYLEPYLR